MSKYNPIYKCKGRWCKIKHTCLRYTAPEIEGVVEHDVLRKSQAQNSTRFTCAGWWIDPNNPRKD